MFQRSCTAVLLSLSCLTAVVSLPGVGSATPRVARATAVGSTQIRDFGAPQNSLGCLTERRCLLLGDNEHQRPEIAAIVNGAPSAAKRLRGISAFNGGISCPSSRVCYALAYARRHEVLARLTAEGKVAATYRLTLQHPPVIMTALSCASTSVCELTGVLTSNPSYTPAVVARWVHHRIGAEHVLHIRGVTDMTISGIDCLGDDCLGVGQAGNRGMTVSIRHGRPTVTRLARGQYGQSVSCSSSTQCYAVFEVVAHQRTAIMTFKHDRLASRYLEAARLTAISCTRTTCSAAGQTPPSSRRPPYGEVQEISGGRPQSTETDVRSDGFTNVARLGNSSLATGINPPESTEIFAG